VVDFKTSEECRCELVAHTVMAVPKPVPQLSEDDPLRQYTSVRVAHKYFDALDADFLPVSAARASFGKEDKTGEDEKADIKLMKYLADHQHMTPFEYNHATFLVECPLFIRSQIMRHRTFAFNEISRRYTSEDIAFWKPDKWRKQSKSNKQASTDEEFVGYVFHEFGKDGVPSKFQYGVDTTAGAAYKQPLKGSLEVYEALIFAGICREQARAVLPQSLLTRFYMGGSLRNWVHFLRLRLDSHAQVEVQIVARKIESQLRELWPEAMGVLLPIEES